MKMSGEELIPASRETVWKALNDPAVLQKCIPGCETITKTSPTRMEAKVVIKLGPVKAGFSGVVNLTEMNPPISYRISGEGKGGLAGFAKGGADVRLEETDGGTKLIYDVDAQVGGKLAMLGSRLIDSTARSLAGQFFEKFAEIAGSMKEAAPAPVAAAPKAIAPKKAAAKKAPAKAPAKKAAVKAPAKKAPAKKAAAVKPAPAKKAVAKKAVAKKPAAKKAPAKKAAAKKKR